jgi:chromosome segregation ATPase
MELTMLREDRDRQRAKNQSVVESAITSHSQLEYERDEALAAVRDLKQQLAAALADLEVANADKARIITANNNLQAALEAFQDERRSEMDFLDEQRKEAEEAITSAHAAAMDAARQAHDAELKQVQNAADRAVSKVMSEVKELEVNLEKLRSENRQMRRSLDEAIHRLQTTQEDVIDRTLMKNILLDWCTMREKDKRHQVLQLMANVLHFSEEEKEKVHLTHMDIDSVRAKVVGAFAASLPPSKADVEHLEGSNVREKWVNFLLSETEDGS